MNTKLFKSLIAIVLTCLCICSLFVTSYAAGQTTEADASDVKMDIVANNVSYSDSLYILYAISNEGFDRTKHEIKMLFWDKAQESYALGTEKYSVTNSGTAKVKGKSCLIFYSDGIAAKEMADDVFARACVVIEGREYYTDVMKFSVLEYVHAMKEQGNIGNGQIKLFTSMLNYGTAAQNSFGHNTSRPANGTYYKISVSGGKLPDGFDNGRYLAGEKVVITPDEPAPGMRFSHWVDEDGIIVSFDKELEITVGEKSKEYVAVYKDISNVVAQLMLKGEIPYNGSIEDIDLPTAVTFEINGESVTLEVTWDTSEFELSKIGKQNIYANLVDTSAYAAYGIEPGSIVYEVNTLAFAYELDSSNGEYVITGYYGDAESVTIPSVYRNIYISRIASRAFNRVMTLKEVIVPDTVKKIDNGAFFYCDNIEKITLPFIGESANSLYTNSWFGWIFGATQYDAQHGILPIELYSVTLKDGAKTVPQYAFYNCAQITEFNIPDTVETIRYQAFYYCKGLTEFTIPSSLVDLGAAFYGCSNLKKVNASSLDSLFNIYFSSGDTNIGLLSNGSELYCDGKLVREVRIPDGLTNVSLVLQGCASIEKITVPSSVKSFDFYAFSGMTSLKEVVFENPGAITDLGYGMFWDCTSLVSADFSEFTSLKIMEATFAGCTSLESVKLPAGLTEIDGSMFSYTAIKSIVLPEGIQKIPYGCFMHCKQLESIVIPDGVVEIGDSAFSSCSSLCDVVMPAALTTIGSSAFASCNKLTVIDLPERVYDIKDYAFAYCSKLAKLIIRSERLSVIGSNAFYKSTKLYEIYNLSDINITAGADDNGYIGKYAKVIHTSLDEESQVFVTDDGFFIYTSDTENLVYGYFGADTEIVIPAPDNGKPTVIADELLYANSSVSKITISEGITTIGSSAFQSCSSLTSVVIVDSVTTIGSSAFYNCTNLETVVIPNSVTTIGSRAFGFCSNLSIYCEAESQPNGWDSDWKSSQVKVIWGYKETN